MKYHMLYVKSIKTFEFQLKFDHHFNSKPNRIILNSVKLLWRCFYWQASYVTKCAKITQIFTIVFTCDIMKY
jgi:hypothetical protein